MFNTLLAIMASQFIGVKYTWGGQDNMGMDCSGLVLKSLHEVGITLPDMTSQSIYHWATETKSFQSCEPTNDCLLFFGSSTSHISHIAIGLGDYDGEPYMIESGGAGRESATMSEKDLARIDARVRIKPISNRGDLVASVKLKY